MSDSFTVTTHTSWFKRIANSVVGVLIGILLIIGMIVLLFWNEGRAVQTAKSLAEGAAAVVSVGADSVDAANEGKLVHVTGPMTTSSTPADTDFGISSAGVRLVRNVSMYQWTEDSESKTEKKLGGGEETVTTYTYKKEWSDSAVDSSDFKQPDGHANPSMEIRGKTIQVPDGKLVAFDLDTPVIDRIGGDKAMPLGNDKLSAVSAAYAGAKMVSIVDGRIYLGANPTSPAIGDYRIEYELAPLGDISVIGRQTGSKFGAYQTQAGDTLLMVDNGVVPADKMFADAVTENTIITWILRAVGLLLLAIGFGLFMGPIGVLADVIPPLGSVVRMGTGLVAFLLAIVVGAITIAIAWFWCRPLLAIGILVGAAVIAFLITRLGKAKQAPAPAQPAGT